MLHTMNKKDTLRVKIKKKEMEEEKKKKRKNEATKKNMANEI